MSSEQAGWAIDVSAVSKRYQFGTKGGWSIFGKPESLSSVAGHDALKDVSFKIARGEAVGVLGRNGAGKSTLLQILTGVLQPTEGRVCVSGRIGALLELGSGFNPELSGRENIFLSAAVLGMSLADVKGKLSEIESFAELGEFIHQPLKTYSSGMFVRLAFSVQVHLDPEILIIDEALSVGDMFFQQKCIARIRELIARGVTLLFVSHSVNAVKSICGRAILLERGGLVADGPADEVCEHYQNSMSSTSVADLHAALAARAAAGVRNGVIEARPVAREREVWCEGFAERLSSRSGGGEVQFTGFEVVSPARGAVAAIEQAGLVTLRIQFDTLQAIPEGSVLGLLVRDAHGIDIVAYNLNFYGRHLPALDPETRYVLEYAVELPLAKGRYSFHVGLKPAPDSPYFYDRCFTIGVLDIEANPLSWGEYGGRLLASPRSVELLKVVSPTQC